MNWKLIFCNPSPLPAQKQIPVSLLENPTVSGRVLYEIARQLYQSQEESLRSLQTRASHLLNVSILGLTGGIFTFLNLSSTCWWAATFSLFFLILACVILLLALRPIPYAEHFSPWCVTEIPDLVNSEDRFLLWLALSYDVLIQSANQALKTIAARVFLATFLLIVGLVLFVVTMIVR